MGKGVQPGSSGSLVRTAQQEEVTGGREPWAAAFCGRAGPDSQSWYSHQTLLYMNGCKGVEKAMATHSSTLAWTVPWTEEAGGLQSMGSLGVRHDSVFTFTFHFHALEKEMATHSSVLAWRIPGTGEPGVLPSMGSHKVDTTEAT